MVYYIRRGLLVVMLALVGFLTSFLTTAPASTPQLPPSTPSMLHRSFDGLWALLDLALRYPTAFLVTAFALLLPSFLSSMAALAPRRARTDAVRLFTASQKNQGAARADGRCEMETVWFTRCRRNGEHGDHWHPWSKGGATNMDNYVHACASHNLAKGGRVPTFWETRRLAWRRRSYFPSGAQTRPGARV